MGRNLSRSQYSSVTKHISRLYILCGEAKIGDSVDRIRAHDQNSAFPAMLGIQTVLSGPKRKENRDLR